MKDNTYVTIQHWMRTELQLSGTDLLVYAIIYGFSQDGETKFSGNRQYLADWCGCTVRSIQTSLNTLVERGIITKYESVCNNIKTCSYVANFTTGEKISLPSEKISLNNISNTINSNTNTDILSKDNIQNINNTEYESHGYSKNDFIGSVKKKPKQKRNSLYDNCVNSIYLFTKNGALIDALIKYLGIRLANKDKPLYTVNQWNAILKKLDTFENQVEIVNQSSENGWCSFFPLKETYTNTSSKKFAEDSNMSISHETKTEEERRQKLRELGEREIY